MINLMRADLYRIVRGKGIYIALALMIAMIGLSIYLCEAGSLALYVSTEAEMSSDLNNMSYEEIQGLSMKELREIMLNGEGYELDRDILAHNMNLYYVFIFVVAIVVAADFSGSCVKNTLSSSISRKQYFFAKLGFNTLCCLVLFFLNTYLSYFANIIFNNQNLASSLGTVTKISLMQLPPILALVSILTGFSFILKRTAIFNTIMIPFFMIVQLLLSLAANFLKLSEEQVSYDIQVMLSKLAYHPSDSYILNSYIICGVVIIVFVLLGYLSFYKAEIK